MLDNTEFLTVVHQLVSDSKECIDKLTEYNRKNAPDEDIQVLIVSATTLLTIHNKLVVQLAEQNSDIVDRANELLEQLQNLKKDAAD